MTGVQTCALPIFSLGGDSPVDQLIKIGEAGGGIEKAATGMEKIGKAMEGFSKISKDSMAAINDFPWIRATAFVAAGGEMSVDNASVKNVSKAGVPDTGAQMNAIQADTSEAEAESVAAPAMMAASIGGSKKVSNSINTVNYSNNNVPDRTLWQVMPAYGF